MKENFVNAVIRLFKSVPTEASARVPFDVEALAARGVYLAEDAVKAFPAIGLFADEIVKAYGYDLLEVNNGFHKSFKAVAESTPEKLALQQILHYLSVFGQNGMDDRNSDAIDSSIVYIPNEVLSLPADKEPVRLTVIHALSDKEIVTRASAMLSSGLALSESTQNDLMEIVRQFPQQFTLATVANKEFRIRMMDELGLMPSNADDFIRYLVFKKTDSAMVIHSSRAVQAVLGGVWNSTKAFRLFVAQNGVEAIAKCFNRHRDLWLAFKHDGASVATIINKARKLSVKLNRPMKVGVLDRIGDKSVTLDEVVKALPSCPLAKKVSIANSLLRRAIGSEQSVFVVRNGRMFVKQNEGVTMPKEKNDALLSAVIDSIVADIRPAVEGKHIRLSDTVNYAFPTSEKNFVGNIPMYSSLDLSDNAIVGIHWQNLPDSRVDLDLHYVSNNRSVGWSYGIQDKAGVYHSGDMTDAPAPLGAAEALCVTDNIEDEFAAIALNRFAAPEGVPVPYSLFFGKRDNSAFNGKYLVNHRELMLNIGGMENVNPQQIVGLLHSDSDGTKTFYFVDSGFGSTSVSSGNPYLISAIRGVLDAAIGSLSLRDVLPLAGAILEPNEDGKWDIDLSLNALTKDSFRFLWGKKA